MITRRYFYGSRDYEIVVRRSLSDICSRRRTYLIVKGKSKFFKMFGVIAVVLSSGDSFHLIHRVYALLTTGLEANAFTLGSGKLIASITMTIF